MKQKCILLIVGVVFSIIGFAQEPGSREKLNPEEMIKKQTEQMVKSLGLNAEQEKKVSELNKKYGEKFAKSLKTEGEDREKRREQMLKIRNEKDVELKAILTADQFKKYKEFEQKRLDGRKQQRETRSGDQPERRGAPRGSGNQ